MKEALPTTALLRLKTRAEQLSDYVGEYDPNDLSMQSLRWKRLKFVKYFMLCIETFDFNENDHISIFVEVDMDTMTMLVKRLQDKMLMSL